MKLKEYIKLLNNIVKNNPEKADVEVCFSSDDEGNSYHSVHNQPALAQIHDIKEYDKEVVGFYGEENIDIKDCNAIIIN